MASPDHWKSRTLLMVAAAIVAALMFVPYGWVGVYPFQLFGTFIHEAGHAIAAVATGGVVHEFVVNPDTSGHVLRQGGHTPLVASAGYLSSVIAGAALLYAGRHRDWARPALLALGAATLLITAVFAGGGGTALSLASFALYAVGLGLFVVGNSRAEHGASQAKYVALGLIILAGAVAFSWLLGGLVASLIGIGMGAAAIFVALYTNRFIQHLTVLFLGVKLSLDGLSSLAVLWNITAQGHGHNDAVNMAEATALPAQFWAITWAAMSLVVLAGAFWMFWRRDKQQ